MERNGRPSRRLGLVLRAYRVAAALTQAQLASRAAMSIGALRDLEQGRTTRPRAASVARLAEVLQLSPGQREELAVLVAPRPDDGGTDQGRAPGQDDDAPAGVRLAVLGPLMAWRDRAAVGLGPARQRAVLGLLAVHEQSGLSREVMISALWGDKPPATAGEMIQGYVSRLRRLLWPDAGTGSHTSRREGMTLFWDGASYRLAAGAVHCDLAEFSRLVTSARELAATGDAEQASRLYRQALQLWRGRPLADLEILRSHPALAELDRRHADVVIEYADVSGTVCAPADALPHLWVLAGREPLEERVHAKLMTILAASGQRAAALQVYEDLRHRLDEELGIRPGPELAEAHMSVLRHEAHITVEQNGQRSQPGTATPERARPRQLPPDSGHFAGRAVELAQLSGLLGQAGADAPGTVVISAIGGMAGVGKTALAIHWAHQVSEMFPDGQLYVNLRGFGPSGNPVTPDAALGGFLDALGVPPQRIPADPSAQAGMYRSMVSGRQILIVLDNGRDEAQLRPLLPASPTCLVVVTSRIQLTGLVAAEGARLVNLDVLTDVEAHEMLIRRLGAERVAADPEAETELITLCGRLPLALAVTAARAASQAGFSLAALATELRDDRTRLSLLGSGDPATSVQAVFSWSYQNLPPPTARMFRLLSLHPATGITAYAAANLAAVPLDSARELLRELARAHLLAEPAPGRYAFHDLLRAYGTRQSEALDREEDRRAALTRLFDFYLAAAGAAMDTLSPAERHRRPLIQAPVTPLPPLGSIEAASAWLEAERATHVAVAGFTAAHGWPGHTTRLSTIMSRYYRDIGGHYADALAVHTYALHAAEQSGDRAGQADALMNRGMVSFQQSSYQQAVTQIERAMDIYRGLDDRRSQARSHSNMGVVLWGWSRYQAAADHFGQALALHRELGDRFGQSIALDNLGTALARQGHYQQAADHHQQALAVRRELGDRRGEARALGNLGAVLTWQGRFREGGDQLELALAMFREFEDRPSEADVLMDLGAALHGQGQYENAIGYHRQALAMLRDLGIRSSESIALNSIGEALHALGRTGQARVHHRDALTLASEIGNQHLEARSHDGLAWTYHATGELDQARDHWERALTRYTALGVPEVAKIRAALDQLNAVAPPKGRD